MTTARAIDVFDGMPDSMAFSEMQKRISTIEDVSAYAASEDLSNLEQLTHILRYGVDSQIIFAVESVPEGFSVYEFNQEEQLHNLECSLEGDMDASQRLTATIAKMNTVGEKRNEEMRQRVLSLVVWRLFATDQKGITDRQLMEDSITNCFRRLVQMDVISSSEAEYLLIKCCHGVSTFAHQDIPAIFVPKISERFFEHNLFDLLRALMEKNVLGSTASRNESVGQMVYNASSTEVCGRITSGQLIAAVIARTKDTYLEKVWVFLENLLRDQRHPEIKKAAAKALHACCLHIPKPRARLMVAPQIFGLMICDYPPVAEQCLKIIISLGGHDCDSLFEDTVLLPIITGYFENKPPKDINDHFMENIGLVIENFPQVFRDSKSRDTFLKHYINSCVKSSDERTREISAKHFGLIAETVGVATTLNQLIPCMVLLARDKSVNVRLRLAENFWTVCKSVQSAASMLTDVFGVLFDDSDYRVRHKLVPDLVKIVELLRRVCQPKDIPALTDAILERILKHEADIRFSWRMIAEMFEFFDTFLEWFSSTQIHQQLVPIIIRHLVNGASQCRQFYAAAIAKTLTGEEKLVEDKNVIEATMRGMILLGRSPTSRFRLAFLDLANAFALCTTETCWRVIFWPVVSAASKDQISCVRRKALRSIEIAANHFSGNLREDLINLITQKLLEDEDNEVAAMAEEMSKLERLGMGTPPARSMRENSGTKRLAELVNANKEDVDVKRTQVSFHCPANVNVMASGVMLEVYDALVGTKKKTET